LIITFDLKKNVIFAGNGWKSAIINNIYPRKGEPSFWGAVKMLPQVVISYHRN
jgi:hypothetical protein